MKPLHIALAVSVAALWGFNFITIRWGLDEFPPLLFNALRFAVASLPFIMFVPRPAVALRWVLGIGVVLGIIKFSLLFFGMDLGFPTGLTSLVLQVQAFFTALFAVVLLGDRPGRLQIAGMVVAFSGIAVIGTTLETGIAGGPFALGLVVAAAAAWGVSNLLLKQAKAPNLFRLMVWVCLVPPLPLFALSFLAEGGPAIQAAFEGATLKGLLSLLYVGVISTIVGFGAWGYLMRHYPASQVAPFSLLVPVFGMSSAAILLDETFGPVRFAGAALVALGLVLNVWKPKSRAAIMPPPASRL